MILIWGRSGFRKAPGSVADSCLICRTARPFRISEVRTYFHLYYILLVRNRPGGLIERCERSGVVVGVDPDEKPESPRDRHAELDDLPEQAPLSTTATIAARAELGQRWKGGLLSETERHALSAEPLRFVASMIEERSRGIHFDGQRLLLPLLMVSSPALAVFVFDLEPFRSLDHEPRFQLGLGLFACAGIALGVWLARDKDRYARRELMPMITSIVHVLKPTREKIGTALVATASSSIALRDAFTVSDNRNALDLYHPPD